MSDAPETYELGTADRALFQDWVQAKQMVEAWEQRRDELAGLLWDRMGKAKRATIDGRPVVNRIEPGEVNRFDERRFREAMPDLWADYVVPQKRSGHLRLVPERQR